MKKFPNAFVSDFAILKKLDTPIKIQNFLDGLKINFEPREDTCRSPLSVLKKKEAQCMEGAMLAAAIFWFHGERPLLLDLKTTPEDDDHVVALFRRYGKWGAISKTNHAVLRYRDPIFASPRELAMSYFNEYFLDRGEKTMRSFSAPFDLSRYKPDWLVSPEDLFYIMEDLDNSKHFNILPKAGPKILRKADKIEIDAGKFTEWSKKNRPAKR